MIRKAKPKQHTAKEIATKIEVSTTNGGNSKSMHIHHDAKHLKIPFEEAKLVNLHVTHLVEPSKPRLGVRSSLKK
ncbi:hypothetical protein V6N13_063647 [Hibiscus sabdariffa]